MCCICVCGTDPEAESECQFGRGARLHEAVGPVHHHVGRPEQSLDGNHERAQLLVLVAVDHLQSKRKN